MGMHESLAKTYLEVRLLGSSKLLQLHELGLEWTCQRWRNLRFFSIKEIHKILIFHFIAFDLNLRSLKGFICKLCGSALLTFLLLRSITDHVARAARGFPIETSFLLLFKELIHL